MMRKIALVIGFAVCASLASADLIISVPYVNNRNVKRVEAGASPKVKVSFYNPEIKELEITGGQIQLQYDPALIDAIIRSSLVNETDSPGQLLFILRQPVKVAAGQTVELLEILFHVNQSPRQANKSLPLFIWADPSQNLLKSGSTNITGQLFKPPTVILEPSLPPEFKGLASATSANAFGVKDPGNTVVLDYRTPAGASDLTKFKGNELSFRVFKSLDGVVWEELSPPPASHQVSEDPDQRNTYTGNASNVKYVYEDTNLDDGTRYFYKVTAFDNTAPDFNEKSNVVVLSVIPQDRNPPEEVFNLKVVAGQNGEKFLKWQNPDTEDLGGIVIFRNKDKPVVDGRMENGKEYRVGDEPFGIGNGQVVFVSMQEEIPSMVPREFTDYTEEEGAYYYRVYTYDRQCLQGCPRQVGLNYSKGIPAVVGLVDGQLQAGSSGRSSLSSPAQRGVPMAFPNPFQPNGGNHVVFQYSLDQSMDIDIYINDDTLKNINKFSFLAGQKGASAGINKVEWDGRSFEGVFASSGLHMVSIVSKKENKALGRIRLMIYR
jgi:hypothetical protein